MSLVLPEIGGGRLDAGHLAAIEKNPKARALRVSGLDQTTFELLVTRYGAQFSAIELWKCPRIRDLSPLEDLAGLRLVSFYWNQHTTALWDLSRTPELTGLHFHDLIHLHDLTDLRAGQALRELEFGDAVWNKSVFETLEPVAELRSLRALRFNAKRIDDGRIQPLAELTGLDSLAMPTNLFTVRQLAWLRARLPDSVKSTVLAPTIRLNPITPSRGKLRDTLLVGKRQPILNADLDRDRIAKHTANFTRMVDEFRSNPALAPD